MSVLAGGGTPKAKRPQRSIANPAASNERAIDFLDQQIRILTVMIEEQIRPFSPAVEPLCTIPASSAAGPNP